MSETCKEKIKGKICGGEIVLHPDEDMDIESRKLCKNRKCVRYYRCRCGMKFGYHTK